MTSSTTGSSSSSSSSSFNPFIFACFSLNYILGTGFLSLPWAFYQAGIILSAVVMTFVCCTAYLSSEYLLTAMARANRILEYEVEDQNATDEDITTELVPVHDDDKNEAEAPANGVNYGSIQQEGRHEEDNSETEQLKQQKKSRSVQDIAAATTTNERLLVGQRRIDIPELTQIFLGDVGFKFYSFCVSIYIYGAMWSFTSVFGCALNSKWPKWIVGGDISNDSYPYFVLLYSLIVVPMSCLELHEQKTVQIILTGSRILMMFLMVVTPLFATFDDSSVPHFGSSSSSDEGEDLPAGAPLFDLSGVHKMLPIMVFAAIFHFSIPALSEQMVDKTQLHKVFAWSFGIVGGLYGCIGIVDAFYFGETVAESANVNWATYTGGTGEEVVVNGHENYWINVALWARSISFFVDMFPAVNVISTFPLHALILGDSLMSIVYGNRMDEVKRNRCITVIYRIIAAVPPLILGLFIRELGRIAGYTGLMGLAIAFVFPPLLHIYSLKRVKEYGISTLSQYETYGSSSAAAKSMLAFGSLSIIFVLILFLTRT